MAVQLVSQAEYAKRRGCSAVAVHKAIKAGRITLIDGKIDPVAADAQWAQNTRARVGAGRPDERPASPAAPDRSGEGDGGYWVSRTRREAAEAEIAELKLAEQRGELVRAADVVASYSRRAAALRESLLQVPARLAAVLAAESDSSRCHDLVHSELCQVLEQVTQG